MAEAIRDRYDSSKAHLLFGACRWWCIGQHATGRGYTLQAAYEDWIERLYFIAEMRHE